jgi:hypothetical protein
LKLWEGHCKYDKSVNGISKFLRHHFLRGYYNNRAPILLHLNADWLKEYVKETTIEIMPNVGYSNKEKIKVEVEKKEYRNLDGLIRFINITLTNNKDVYFVTARKAIQWMGLLERLQTDDMHELIENELFDDCFVPVENYDGKCEFLKQSEPDFNQEESIILDDSFGEELKKKLKLTHGGDSLLMDLQSEVLFVNHVVLYFILALVFSLIIIIIKDRYF